MPKSPISDRQRRLLEQIDAMERQVQAVHASRDTISTAPPLPATDPTAPAAPTFVENPLRANAKATASDLKQVAINSLGLSPLSIHPLGFAIGAGSLLGNLAVVGMRAVERQKLMTEGSPKERAERAYGQAIEARIKARQTPKRRFR